MILFEDTIIAQIMAKRYYLNYFGGCLSHLTNYGEILALKVNFHEKTKVSYMNLKEKYMFVISLFRKSHLFLYSLFNHFNANEKIYNK